MLSRPYKLNSLRVFEFWIAPALIAAFILFLVYADYEKNSRFELGKLVGYSIVILLFLGPFVWLYFNHLKNMQVTQLQFGEKDIRLYKEKAVTIISYDEIVDIVEYSISSYGNGKLPWSGIFKLHIKTKNQEFIISSLIISKTNLKKFLKREWQFEATYFPTM